MPRKKTLNSFRSALDKHEETAKALLGKLGNLQEYEKTIGITCVDDYGLLFVISLGEPTDTNTVSIDLCRQMLVSQISLCGKLNQMAILIDLQRSIVLK